MCGREEGMSRDVVSWERRMAMEGRVQKEILVVGRAQRGRDLRRRRQDPLLQEARSSKIFGCVHGQTDRIPGNESTRALLTPSTPPPAQDRKRTANEQERHTEPLAFRQFCFPSQEQLAGRQTEAGRQPIFPCLFQGGQSAASGAFPRGSSVNIAPSTPFLTRRREHSSTDDPAAKTEHFGYISSPLTASPPSI